MRLPTFLISLAVTASLAGLRLLDPLPVASLRLTVFDMFQRLEPRNYEPAPVIIVDIDDESLARIGQWPWPRTRIAAMVERLSELGASALAFAVVFAEPDRTTPSRVMESWARSVALNRLAQDLAALPDHDAVLAETLSAASSAPAVLGFSPTKREGGELPPVKFGFAHSGGDPTPSLARHGSAVGNLPILNEAVSGLGSLAIRLDADGAARRMALVTRIEERIYPSLGLEALRVAQGASTLIAKTAEGAFGDALLTALKVGAFTVPTDGRGEIWLHYTGPVQERTVQAWRLFEADGGSLRDRIAGRIAIVGVSASGLDNGRATPINPVETAASIHAQALEQMILGRFLTRADWADGVEILVLPLLCGFLTWIVVYSRHTLPGALAGLLASGTVWLCCWLAFDRAGQLFDPLFPTLSIIVVYLFASGLRYLAGERERRRVRAAFGRYLAPEIVERLAKHPEELKLGGETRELTVMFCDIRGFTSMAEGMAAEELTELVNRFLTPMSQEILEAGGTIDKYMGDAIMAFWNAPVRAPDHGLLACRAALAMVRRLEGIRPAWRMEAERAGKRFHNIHIGIGLNTGPCCVGNLGSEQRFDYSALGDAVNVASRLESQTRLYGVDIVAGEDAQRLAGGLAWLELDRVRVRGRGAAITIFALMGDEMEAGGGFAERRARHDEALAAYRRRDWDGAAAHFEDCRTRWRGELDDLYALYALRLDALRRAPPGADWDGVFPQNGQWDGENK